MHKALGRLGTTLTAGAMSLVLSAAEGMSHDWHAMWRVRREAQATDMTTNQNLSSSGCGAFAQESQIEATGTRSLSTAAAESLRSSKLLSFGHQQLPALAAVSNNDPARTQQLQLFLDTRRIYGAGRSLQTRMMMHHKTQEVNA